MKMKCIKIILILKKYLNKKDSIRFLKTHSCFVNTNKFKFTDRHNTLGVIYIVEIQEILFIFSHHFQDNRRTIFKIYYLISILVKLQKHCTTYLGFMENHYNSWKVFRRFNKYLLVRYEDLINDTEKTFLNILKFIAHLGRVKFSYDEKKFENTLKNNRI